MTPNLKTTAEAVLAAGESVTIDCGDNSCSFAKERGGMRTNGGCRCIRDLPFETRQFIKRLHLAANSAEPLAQGYLNLLKKYEILEEALQELRDTCIKWYPDDLQSHATEALEKSRDLK